LSLVCPYVKSADHVYEVMRLLADSQLSAIPVVGEDSNYAGLITLEDLLHYFAKIASFSEPGSILVMEIQKRDYSLAEIARIVESENALIISCFITSHSTMDDNKMEVTIKVNRQNIQAIIGAFERFDYQIKASFNEINYIDSLRERYDALMSYLNV
jgi:signal-transduction protein with cAMP-binding, CBS, and nucleotidyltransferase domain